MDGKYEETHTKHMYVHIVRMYGIYICVCSIVKVLFQYTYIVIYSSCENHQL